MALPSRWLLYGGGQYSKFYCKCSPQGKVLVVACKVMSLIAARIECLHAQIASITMNAKRYEFKNADKLLHSRSSNAYFFMQ